MHGGVGKMFSSPFSGERYRGKGNTLNLKKMGRQLFYRRQQEMDILTHLDGRNCRRWSACLKLAASESSLLPSRVEFWPRALLLEEFLDCLLDDIFLSWLFILCLYNLMNCWFVTCLRPLRLDGSKYFCTKPADHIWPWTSGVFDWLEYSVLTWKYGSLLLL